MRKKYALLFITLLAVHGVSFAKQETPLAPPEAEPTQPGLTIDSWKPKPVPKPAPLPEAPPAPKAPAVAVSHSTSSAPAQTALPVAVPVKAVPAAPPVPAVPAKASAEPAHPPVVRRAMNEMTGALASVDTYAQSIRLSVEGGFNPQLAYDSKTEIFESGGHALKLEDLHEGDKIIVRYIGRDLTAREIERVKNAPSR